MWRGFKNWISEYFSTYRMRKIGFLLGVLFGIIILILGPLYTFFLMFCGIIGLYIGSRFDDEEEDLVHRTLRAIENALPERFQHW